MQSVGRKHQTLMLRKSLFAWQIMRKHNHYLNRTIAADREQEH